MRIRNFLVGCSVAMLAQTIVPGLVAQQPNYSPTINSFATQQAPTPTQNPGDFASDATGNVQIRWRSSMAEARQEAERTGKPILLHFYQDNCVYCAKLEKGAFQHPGVLSEIEANFVPVKVFAPQNEKITQHVKVDRFPSDVIVDAQGRILARSLSPQDPVAYVSMLTNSLKSKQSAMSQAANNYPAGNYPANNYPALGYAAQNYPAPSQQTANNGTQDTAFGSTGQLVSNGNQMIGPYPQAQAAQTHLGPEIQGAQVPAQPYPAQTYTNQPTANPYDGSNQVPGAGYDMRSNQYSASSNDSGATSPGLAKPSLAHYPPQPEPSVQVEAREPMVEGYCLVTLVNNYQWKLGDPNIGAIHMGCLYLFTSEDARRTFLADPDRFAPVMNGLDVVKFFDEGRIVEGVRAKGCTTKNPERLFFFSSEETLAKFEANEQTQAYYTRLAVELTERAAADANGKVLR